MHVWRRRAIIWCETFYESVMVMTLPDSVAEQRVDELCTILISVGPSAVTVAPELKMASLAVKVVSGKAANGTKPAPLLTSSRIHSALVPEREVPPLTVPTIDCPVLRLWIATDPLVLEVIVTLVVIECPVLTLSETDFRAAGNISVQAKVAWEPSDWICVSVPP